MSDIRAQSRRDAEFDRLLRATTSDDLFTEGQMYQAYEMGKRHGREEGPRWHDAPTCAGLWVVDGDAYEVDLWSDGRLMIDDGGSMDEPWEGRWFGPIPADEVKP